MIELHPARPGGEFKQKALWHTVFGDSAEVVDCFYRCCYQAADTVVLEEDGQLAAMLTLLPMELVSPDGEAAKAWYVYALAADPLRRRQGFGRQLLQYVDYYLQQRQADCATVVPAEPSLYSYFAASGFEPCFAVRETERSGSSLPPASGADPLQTVDPAAYNAIRDAQLRKDYRVRCGDSLIRYQEGISQFSGAGLYAVTIEGETGCAAVERIDGDSVICKELLISPPRMEQAIAWIAQRHSAYRCCVRTPACWEGMPGGYIQPFGMVKWYNPKKAALWSGQTCGYLGLGFD